jgi:tRNA (guanine26-N2/guanine27-N2)-dimethyltransferase
MNEIIEGSAKLEVKVQKIVDKKMPVFYNPDMKLNRDLTILILKENLKPNMRVGLPLAGSGIRGIRIIKEVSKDIEVHVNDIKKGFDLEMAKTCQLNEVELNIHNEDANVFLNKLRFDYVDVDPFGSPNPFLDSAIRSMKNKGILSVTATDTGALSGSFVKACQRKYFATPKRDHKMHDTGIRILIRKVQLIGGSHDVCLTPIYSISNLHYMKVFFRVEKSKTKVDLLLNKHEMREGAGPLWTGDLWDLELAEKIAKQSDTKILDTIATEAKTLGELYDVHVIAKEHKLIKIPKFEDILLKVKGSRTHFSDTMIKTSIKEKELVKLIQQLSLHQ